MPHSDLVRFWNAFSASEEAPFIHPDDRKAINASRHSRRIEESRDENYEMIIMSKDLGLSENNFYFSLLPAPYAGDLKRADIFILLLNPGFSGVLDFYSEYCRPDWRARLLATISQELDPFDFPNISLDPQFCWTGGYQWWERKLRAVGQKIASELGTGYRDVLQTMSRRIACIELVPYHSKAFSGHKLLNNLKSAEAARNFVKDELLPQAKADKISLIVTRQAESWGLKNEQNTKGLVVYRGPSTRAAHLGPETDGGIEILRRFRITQRRR